MSHAPIAAPIKIVTYYVVPVIKTNPLNPIEPPRPQVQACLYFDCHWQQVPAADLPSAKGETFVGLVQPPASQAMHHLPPDYTVDFNAVLLAAVAKTLTQPNQPPTAPQPNVFVAATPDGLPTLVIPVSTDTRRGVILIFMTPDGVNVTRLAATADPEISNSTGAD